MDVNRSNHDGRMYNGPPAGATTATNSIGEYNPSYGFAQHSSPEAAVDYPGGHQPQHLPSTIIFSGKDHPRGEQNPAGLYNVSGAGEYDSFSSSTNDYHCFHGRHDGVPIGGRNPGRGVDRSGRCGGRDGSRLAGPRNCLIYENSN